MFRRVRGPAVPSQPRPGAGPELLPVARRRKMGAMKRILSTLLFVSALAVACKSSGNAAGIKANATCPISGKAVDTASYYEYGGSKIYTCCPMCVGKVKADPAAAMAKAYPK